LDPNGTPDFEEAMMIKVLCGALALMGLLAAGAARADEKTPANDREFVAAAANGGYGEVKLGELAEKRAANERVKAFGARMVKDHTEANKKLTDAAKNLKVAVVTGFDPDARKMFMGLSKLQGDEFDRHYMRMMVEDHEKDVAEIADFAKKAMDPEIKKWCEDVLPIVREHLKMAKEINDVVNKK
jgi:putative membrane protein